MSDTLTPLPSAIQPAAIVDCYLRDSGGEGQDRSINRQLESIKAYCLKHGLQLRHIYKDEARSGKTTATRDQFDRMIAATREPANRPAAILLWNYARFARDLDDSTYYKTLLRKKRGIIVHSLTDPIPEGQYARLVEFLIDVANEEKLRQTSIDTKDGLRSIVMQGAIPGVPPRGIKREPIVTLNPRTGEQRKNHRWIPDPKYIHRIRTAFNMRAANKSLDQIQKQTKLFSSINSYATFWKNPIYYGTLQYGDITIENYCQPIVDKDIWQKVQLIQQGYAQSKNVKTGDKNHPRRANSDFLLSGLARCAKCGSPLFGRTSHQKTGHKYQSYLCTLAYRKRGACSKGRIPKQTFENAVLNALTEHILKIDTLREISALSKTRGAERNAEIDQQRKSKQAEIASVKKRLANTADAISESGSSPTLLARLKELEREQLELQQELAEIEQTAQTAAPYYLPEEIAAELAALNAILKSKNPEDIKTVLRGMIAYIDVARVENTLTGTIYYYPPDNDTIPPPEEHPPPKADDDVPTTIHPSGPPSRRHIIAYSFTASTKRPR